MTNTATTHARLRLRPPGGRDRFVDGGWWPESSDLAAELPALVAAVEAAGYAEIRRISFQMAGWDTSPRKPTINGRVIKLSGYRFGDPTILTLIDTSGSKRVDLLVVPPHTAPDVAERALDLAGTAGDTHRAGEILGLAAPGTRAASPTSALAL